MSNALPIEVSVWSGATPTNEMAILEGASSAQWTDLFGDVGAGSCELSFYDAKATALNMAEGNLIQFALGGIPIFGFFSEAPILTIGEASDSKWTLAGQSVLAYMNRAIVYPKGGIASPVGTHRIYSGKTFGNILKTLIDEAQARGTIPAMTYDFTSTLDSHGNAWTANVNVTIDVGTSLLDVLKKFVALGMGLTMDPMLGLHCFLPGALGLDRTSTVIWRQGYHLAAPVDNVGSRSNATTVCLVRGSNGSFVETTDPAWTGNAIIGRRESGLDFSAVSSDTTQMTNAGNQQITLSETASRSLTVPLTHGLSSQGLYEPYTDYNPGDTIALDVPGAYTAAPFQIVGLTVAQTPGANYTVEANLGSLALPLDLRTAQRVSSISGSSSPLAGGTMGNLTLGNPTGFPSGPSYLDSPTTGTAWFRSDVGAWYWWDGTYWEPASAPAPAVQNLATATQIVIPSGYCGLIRVTSSTGNKTLSATPTLSPGTVEGQWVVIQNQDGTYTQTLQDRGTLVGSKLNLVANTQTIAKNLGNIQLTWTFTTGAGRWIQTGALVAPL